MIDLIVPSLAPMLVARFVVDVHFVGLVPADERGTWHRLTRGAAIEAVLHRTVERPLAVAAEEWARTTPLPRRDDRWAGEGRSRAPTNCHHVAPGWCNDRFACPLRFVVAPPLDRSWALRRSGTLLGDLRLLASAQASSTDTVAALDRVVENISWAPRNPSVRRALRLRAISEGREVEQVKRQELRAAVFLALGERRRPQVHRFGSRWLIDDRGRQQTFVPEDLPDALFWRWFQDEVRKIAEASLRDQSSPWTITTRRLGSPDLLSPDTPPTGDQSNDPFDKDASLPTPARSPELLMSNQDPLDVLIEWEHRHEIARRWNALLTRATPRQRDILRALADSDAGYGPVTLADVAQRLKLAQSTVRVHWKRLIDRVRAENQ